MLGPVTRSQATGHTAQAGFTLIEALVAMMIVAMVVIQYIGIRTTALMDATQARNSRLAREIAEEKMSELQAGALETPPESGQEKQLEKYAGFAYKIVIGESSVADVETEVANSAIGDNSVASERLEWQRERDDFRNAKKQGLSAADYADKQHEDDYQRRIAETPPSADEFEEVAVVVYFPKLNATFEGERDALLIKARLSTLALSGLTPKQAMALAAAKGSSSEAAGGGSAAGALGSGSSGSGSGSSGSSGSGKGGGR